MPLSTKARAVAVAAVLAAAAPAPALAQAGGHHGDRAGRDGSVPARVASKVRAAERALERAQAKADDSDSAGAATSLGTARRNLASALKAAQRRVVANGTQGPGSAGAVSGADDDAVDGTVDLLDGADDALSGASITTLDAAIANRDEILKAIAALGTDDQADYSRVLARIEAAIADEKDNIDESLADDTLTDEAKAGLQDALTRLAASQASVDALQASSGDASTSDSTSSEDVADDTGASGQRRPCDGRGRGGSSQDDPASSDTAATGA